MLRSNSLTGGILIIVVLIYTLVPIALIWALNTLFPVLQIPYTFQTWLASFVLFGCLTASKNK